jgi:hypothetical protein
MAFDSYTAFRSNIVTWCDFGESTALTNTQLDDVIRVAERKVGRKVRCRQNETALNVTIANGVVSIPTNYLELKSAYIDGSPTQKLERRNVDYIYDKYPTRSSTSKPKFISREGSNFVFGPYPDSGYTVKGTFYKRMPNLSTTLHGLFTVAEDLYLWAACAEASESVGDDKRFAIFDAKYQRTLAEVNGEDSNEAGSGGGLAIRPQ